MREIIISIQEEGQRLDRYLVKYLPGASSAFLHKMLRKKNIKYNDGKASGGEKLKAGDRIKIFFSEDTMMKFGAPARILSGQDGQTDIRSGQEGQPDSSITPGSGSRELAAAPAVRGRCKVRDDLRSQVRVLYEDKDILILHKPAGMLSQKASPTDDSLNDYLLDYWRDKILQGRSLPAAFRPSVANRLDRNTSGIVLCGLTVKGLALLADLLKSRDLDKYYLCIVKGQMQGGRKISGYLTKDKRNNKVELYRDQVPGSSYIETAYQVLKSGKDVSLLKVKLITGKSHQIRVHLASQGHPILGDPKYGDPVMNRQLKKSGIRHQMLHSYELIFPDRLEAPLGGLHIIDDLPADFQHLAGSCGWKSGYQA